MAVLFPSETVQEKCHVCPLSQVGARPVMTLDIAKMENSNNTQPISNNQTLFVHVVSAWSQDQRLAEY